MLHPPVAATQTRYNLERVSRGTDDESHRKRVRDGPAQDGAHERLVVVNDCHKLVLYRLCAEALGDLARRVDAGLSGEIDGLRPIDFHHVAIGGWGRRIEDLAAPERHKSVAERRREKQVRPTPFGGRIAIASILSRKAGLARRGTCTSVEAESASRPGAAGISPTSKRKAKSKTFCGPFGRPHHHDGLGHEAPRVHHWIARPPSWPPWHPGSWVAIRAPAQSRVVAPEPPFTRAPDSITSPRSAVVEAIPIPASSRTAWSVRRNCHTPECTLRPAASGCLS